MVRSSKDIRDLASVKADTVWVKDKLNRLETGIDALHVKFDDFKDRNDSIHKEQDGKIQGNAHEINSIKQTAVLLAGIAAFIISLAFGLARVWLQW